MHKLVLTVGAVLLLAGCGNTSDTSPMLEPVYITLDAPVSSASTPSRAPMVPQSNAPLADYEFESMGYGLQNGVWRDQDREAPSPIVFRVMAGNKLEVSDGAFRCFDMVMLNGVQPAAALAKIMFISTTDKKPESGHYIYKLDGREVGRFSCKPVSL